jgi:Icc-related predicted phosphoesterase
MKIVAIADTHMLHNDLMVPEGDLLIHAGDMCTYGRENEARETAKWWKSLPHPHKIYVPGNHDVSIYENRSLRELYEDENSHVLIDEALEIDGIKFWGSPWTPEFCGWAFMLQRGGDVLANNWAAIPDDTDVLITHGPRFGYGDRNEENLPVGCEALAWRLEQMPDLKYHIFGHIHTDYGIRRFNNTSVINASIHEGTWKHHDFTPPIVFEYGEEPHYG